MPEAQPIFLKLVDGLGDPLNRRFFSNIVARVTEKLNDEVDQVTNILSRTSSEAMSRIRSSIDAAENNTFSEQLDLEMEHQSVLIPKNMQAAAKAFMEKKDPSFEGR